MPLRPLLMPVLLAVAMAACSRGPHADAPPAAMPVLATVPVQAAGTAGSQSWDATVQAVHAAVLMAQTNGRVLALPREVGDTVTAGDVVVRLTDAEQQSAQRAAQAQVAAANAAYTEAEANYRRYAAIYPKGYVSRAAYEQMLAVRDRAKAQLTAAQAQAREAGAQQAYTVVRAPFAGVITARYVQVGEAVAGPPFPQKLLALAAPGALRVEAQLPQAVAEALRANPQASVMANGERVAAGRLQVFPVADPSTHTVTMRMDLPDTVRGLYPGMTVKLAFAAPTAANVSIPASAVVSRGELQGAYVVDGARVSLRQLRTGDVAAGRVEVLSGLAAGERVAVDPAAAARTVVAQHQGAGR